MKRSDRVIQFIELLRIPDGKGAGQPVRLREWQKKIIRGIYDPAHPDGRRKVRRVLLSMARKNGKTALIAFLVLVHLVGPESGLNQQIYSAAMDREQAGVIYNMCEKIVELDDDLSALIRPIPSRKRLVCHANGSFFQALSKDSRTKHGFNPAVWIFDEFGQAKDSELYDVLDTGQGAQDEPLGIVISTQAQEPKAPMSQIVDDAKKVIAGITPDDSLAAFIFEVPIDADPFDESLWHLANPALGDFRSLEDMRALAKTARRLPSKLNTFKNLYLNQQVSGLENIIGPVDWAACGDDFDEAELIGRPCFGGLDLAQRRDICAFVLIFPPQSPGEKWKVLCYCWTPEGDLAERELRDKAPYQQWIDEGFLTGSPGRSVSFAFVAEKISELADRFEIQGIAYDAWKIEAFKDTMRDIGLNFWVEGKDERDDYSLRLVKHGQGFKDMGPSVDAVEEVLIAHAVAHRNHPILTWAAANAVAESDPIGNRRLNKKKARNKIDPFVALTMATGLATRGKSEEGDEITQGFVDVEAA